jgi:hypothetical protein
MTTMLDRKTLAPWLYGGGGDCFPNLTWHHRPEMSGSDAPPAPAPPPEPLEAAPEGGLGFALADRDRRGPHRAHWGR